MPLPCIVFSLLSLVGATRSSVLLQLETRPCPGALWSLIGATPEALEKACRGVAAAAACERARATLKEEPLTQANLMPVCGALGEESRQAIREALLQRRASGSAGGVALDGALNGKFWQFDWEKPNRKYTRSDSGSTTTAPPRGVVTTAAAAPAPGGSTAAATAEPATTTASSQPGSTQASAGEQTTTTPGTAGTTAAASTAAPPGETTTPAPALINAAVKRRLPKLKEF